MEITFVRHAEKETLGEDPYLTKKGAKQAKHLAERLAKDNFNEFYCSNMNRAKQTAEIVSKKIKMNPKIEKSLNEFESEDLRKNRNNWNKKERMHYNQLSSFLRKLTKSPTEDKSVLIVAHGITNRVILSCLTGLNLRKLLPFMQSESGINSVYWVERFKNWRLTAWNVNTPVPEKLR